MHLLEAKRIHGLVTNVIVLASLKSPGLLPPGALGGNTWLRQSGEIQESIRGPILYRSSTVYHKLFAPFFISNLLWKNKERIRSYTISRALSISCTYRAFVDAAFSKHTFNGIQTPIHMQHNIF